MLYYYMVGGENSLIDGSDQIDILIYLDRIFIFQDHLHQKNPFYKLEYSIVSWSQNQFK